MSDKKFERQYDRNLVPLDAKQRLIDLMANPFELPETGIYDEPVRYFKANLLWTPIIFGWLDWLEDIAGWQAAEDDNFRGIQEILVFEEGIDPIMTTPAEMQEAITEGIYKAFNDLAKQVVSGSRANFAVDEDGNVVPPSAGGAVLPEDDPATVINEERAARAGAALSVATGLVKFYEYLLELYGPIDDTPVTPLEDAQFLINSTYLTLPEMDPSMTAYYLERGLGGNCVQVLNGSELGGYIYCHGTLSLQAAIRQYIVTLTTIDLNSKKRMIDLLLALDTAQLDAWFNAGLPVPSSAYHDFPCEPIPDEEILLTRDETKDSNGIAKKNHRYLIKTQGLLTDIDGQLQDTWYFIEPGESPVFNAGHFNVTSTGFTADPTAAQVPYRDDHKYEWTFERDDNHVLHFLWSTNVMMGEESTGQLTINLHDLGSFV